MNMPNRVYSRLTHGFGPVYDEFSETLILGSFPSARSREQGFFYGHPQNRFWKVIAAVYGEEVPGTDASVDTLEKKRRMILSHGLALYDVIEECDIIGSSDSSIRNALPADIKSIIEASRIKRILVNGRTAEKYYVKYQEKQTGIKAIVLPSTSPANAAWHLEELTEAWRRVLQAADIQEPGNRISLNGSQTHKIRRLSLNEICSGFIIKNNKA